MAQEIQAPAAAAGALVALRQRATLEKLARDWNIQPRNQAEAEQLLDIAAHLRAAKVEENIKTAADNGNPFLTQVLDGLKHERRAEGFDTGPTSNEALFKEAADYIASSDQEMAQAAEQWAEYLMAVDATSAA